MNVLAVQSVPLCALIRLFPYIAATWHRASRYRNPWTFVERFDVKEDFDGGQHRHS